MHAIQPAIQALKDVTRLQWMLHFEAIATVGNDEDSLAWGCAESARDAAHVHRVR